MPITPPPSRGASLCNTLLQKVFVSVGSFINSYQHCTGVDPQWRYSLEIIIPPLCFQEWSVLCTHTQTSQHIKHMFTIHKGSSLPEKSVLLRRDYPQPPPTQLSEDLNSVYLYNYYQEGSNTGHLVARAGAQIHNRWENWNDVHNILSLRIN